jgi:hypothetical protein
VDREAPVRSENVVAVTKFEASRRQLNAAILMYFREDDELAIHTVAHAALSILRELLDRREFDLHEDLLTRGFFEMLRLYRLGLLDKNVSEEPTFKEFALQIPEHMWNLIVANDFENVRLSLSGYNKKANWDDFNATYNFLKHADRDAKKALDLERVDNVRVLSYACAAYAKLRLPLTLEMRTFFEYTLSIQTIDAAPNERMQKKVDALRKYDLGMRKAACRYLVGDTITSVLAADID